MNTNELLNIPDLQFVKWCEEHYSINRGVYNTIDQKLFELGYSTIQYRRKALVEFLQANVETTERKFYKFGIGNLSDALQKLKCAQSNIDEVSKNKKEFTVK